jgi:hypothetical protein
VCCCPLLTLAQEAAELRVRPLIACLLVWCFMLQVAAGCCMQLWPAARLPPLTLSGGRLPHRLLQSGRLCCSSVRRSGPDRPPPAADSHMQISDLSTLKMLLCIGQGAWSIACSISGIWRRLLRSSRTARRLRMWRRRSRSP